MLDTTNGYVIFVNHYLWTSSKDNEESLLILGERKMAFIGRIHTIFFGHIFHDE
jgi:hypothetical protein